VILPLFHAGTGNIIPPLGFNGLIGGRWTSRGEGSFTGPITMRYEKSHEVCC
jgi:hypothetical protein